MELLLVSFVPILYALLFGLWLKHFIPMIHNLLPIVGAELNNYFKSRFDIEEDRLILSNLMNLDGSVAVEGNNKVVCSLINVQEETTLKGSPGSSYMGGGYISGGADIHLNLTVMF